MKVNDLLSFLLIIFIVSVSCKENRISRSNQNDALPAGSWKVIGPGGGGGVLKPTVSPFNADFVMTHCDMTGVYVSHNGGINWKMKNLCNVPDDFEFDPADSNTVYVATRGFLHSEDRGSGISMLLSSSDKGETWKIIYPDISGSKPIGKLQSTSILPSEIIIGAVDGTIQKAEVDPFDNRNIYLGIAPLIDYMGRGAVRRDPAGVKIVLSNDHGKTWNEKVTLPGSKVLALFAGLQKDILVVFTDKTCSHINKNNGDHKNYSLPVDGIIAVEGGKKTDGTLIYIQSTFLEDGKGGIYISSDNGEKWHQVNNGLANPSGTKDLPDFRQGLAVCESMPEVAYVSIDFPRKNAKGEFDPLFCVYKTIDAGENWKPVLVSSSYEGYLTKNFQGSWMEKSYDPGWGGSPIDMGVAPGNPEVCYAGDNGRGYKTTDGGKSWIQLYSHNNPDGSFTSSGLDVTTCYGIHFDPFDKDHFFICYTDIGLFHTLSGGKSWIHSVSEIPASWQNTCYDIEFDPEIKGKVWSVWANAHDLPRTKMFGPRGFDGYKGGVAVSMNGGLEWEKCSNGLPENSVCTNILLDLSSVAGKRTLYVSVFGLGIYKSTDDGSSWSLSNNGLGSNLFAWQLRQNSSGRLFALFSRGISNGKVADGEVYYSDNKAESWTRMVLPDSVNGPHDLLVDPVNPEVMYISCWPRTLNGNDIKGGVIKTTDGGTTWKQIFDERVRVNSAGMDPVQTKLIYINTFQNSAYRSENAGETWERIEGYRFKWGQRAVPDIHNPGMIYLTTYGGSVFYGPEKGIPGAPDDITNIPEGWW